jgi:ribosomal protein S18 acetylase RimI-like enzyme
VAHAEVRPATHEDVSAICAMQRASLVETSAPPRTRGRRGLHRRGNVERYFEEHWRQSTVATVDGENVGVLVLEGTVVDLVWVTPAVRSKGIGSTLVDTVERRAAIEGHEVELEVWTVNRRAVDFYERRGFSVDGTTDDPVTGLEKLVMRKALWSKVGCPLTGPPSVRRTRRRLGSGPR